MASPKKNVYWDTCTWLGLINQEPGKVDRCRYVIDEARKGNIQIWTSAFTLAEVFKKNCAAGVPAEGIPAAMDVEFEDYISQDFVTLVQVDFDIGVQARRLLREQPKLKKPADAVHLATAVLNNIDELHTFDADNLIPLSGAVTRQDQVPLIVCFPQEPPPPPPPPPMPLFDALELEEETVEQTDSETVATPRAAGATPPQTLESLPVVSLPSSPTATPSPQRGQRPIAGTDSDR